MSILISIIVIVILGGAALRGFHRGFLKTALSLLSLILTIILVALIQPYVAGVVYSCQPLTNAVTKAVSSNLEEAFESVVFQTEAAASGTGGTVTAEQQSLWLEECSIPGFMREQIVSGAEQAASSFIDTASEKVTDIVVNILSYIITFVIVFVIIRLLFAFFDLIGRVPIIHGVNKWLGAVLGFLQGMFLIWILCLVITLILPSELGQQIMSAINESAALSALYNTCLSLVS